MKLTSHPYPVVINPRPEATIRDIVRAAHVFGLSPHIVLSYRPKPVKAKKRKVSR